MKICAYNNKIMAVGGKWMEHTDQPEPVLPPYTIRLKFTDGITPTFYKGTAVQVSSSPNIWDLTYRNSDWYELLNGQTNLLEVIGGNTTGVTGMSRLFYNCTNLSSVHLFDSSTVTSMIWMFYGCTSLTTVPMFDTSSAIAMYNMFHGCTALTTVPLFDTSSVIDMEMMFFECNNLTSVPLLDTSSATNMNSMFYGCYNVQSGALALYNQASSQATPPTDHNDTFTDCGRDTVTGAAELAQIPSSWGGTMS